MGVYIRSMKMPENCNDCWALDSDGDYPRCIITEEQRGYTFKIREQRMSKCPLESYGRLIDADRLCAVLNEKKIPVDSRVNYEIVNAPTVSMTDRPQGEWIKEYNGDGWNDYWNYKCSNCGKVYERASAILYDANFCPNCGKRMKVR